MRAKLYQRWLALSQGALALQDHQIKTFVIYKLEVIQKMIERENLMSKRR